MPASAAQWNRNSYIQSGGAGNGQPGGSMVDGQFVAGNFIGMFVGPPRLATVGGTVAAGVAVDKASARAQLVYPVGITQNFNLSQNMQLARIFELGSDRSYFIPGRVVGQIGLGRVLYHGPSLLRVLYAYYQDLIPATVVQPLFPNAGAASMPNPHDVITPPGYENFYINLASDLFSQPFGMLTVLRDSNQDTYGATYFEACHVPNHSFSVDSQGVVVQEQVGIQYELAVPIATRALKLIT